MSTRFEIRESQTKWGWLVEVLDNEKLTIDKIEVWDSRRDGGGIHLNFPSTSSRGMCRLQAAAFATALNIAVDIAQTAEIAA